MIKSALLLVVVVILLPYACAPVYRFPPPQPFTGSQFYNPYAQSLPWRRANLHAHGRAWFGVTAAAQTDAEVERAYREHGYDVAAISDYQHIAATGPHELRAYEHGFNIGKHHQLAIGARSVAWFDLPLWQGINQKQYVISRVAATADLVAVAHPAALQGYAYSDEELEQLTGYQLMEVVNGPFVAESSWDAALSSGRAVWVVADDDTHDVTKPDRFGVAWNMIAASSTEPPDIIDALRAGRTYATLQLPDASGPETTVSGVAVDRGRVRVTIAGAPGDISFVGQQGVVRQTVADATTAEYAFRSDDTYIRAVVRTPTRVIFINPMVRYDGKALPVPMATVNSGQTWVERIAILALATLLTALAVRRKSDYLLRVNSQTSHRRVSGFMILLAVLVPGVARGQEPPAPPLTAPLPTTTSDAPLTSTFDANLLSALPTGDSVFSLLETTSPETISNRISTGGIGFSRAARLSAFGSSITQTRYRVGDVDITDPSTGATPMVLPELFFWNRIVVATADSTTPGIAVTFEPRTAAAQWTTSVEASSSLGDALTAAPSGAAPPIARLTAWNRGSLLASGPIAGDRAGLVVGAAFTHEADAPRGSTKTTGGDVGSLFASVSASLAPETQLTGVAWVQRATSPVSNTSLFAESSPALNDTSIHVQATVAHRGPTAPPWRIFAGFSQRSRTPPVLSDIAVVDPLRDGPPLDQVSDTGARTDRRLSAGARVSRDRGAHAFELGADVDLARVSTGPGFDGSLEEFVDTLPSRNWVFNSPSVTSRRHSATLSALASDRIRVADRGTVDVALRFEHLAASADGATQGIGWSSLLPRAMWRSTPSQRYKLTWFVGGGISAYQLPLDALAWGDPAAPSVTVFRLAPPTTALFSVGPGTGRIDPDLGRPYSDDLVFGVEARPRDGVTIQLSGLCRWEKQLFGVVNVSPNAPTYSILPIDDPGLDLASSTDDQVLNVSNLQPSAAARFDNVLTNPDDRTARRLGAKLTAEYTNDRLFLLFGATAFAAEGVASNRGSLETANDQGVIGDESFDPNSAIFARGRLFGDRAFTGKLAGVYRFPADVTLGAIARYHDGQPFARLVLVPNLNQGPDVVRAYANGGSRFTFTATLDVRVQKGFVVNGHSVAAFVDAYNLLNLGYEVEEQAITGSAFRTPTAIQPPRTLHVGAKFSF